jgi:hypothetical protein
MVIFDPNSESLNLQPYKKHVDSVTSRMNQLCKFYLDGEEGEEEEEEEDDQGPAQLDGVATAVTAASVSSSGPLRGSFTGYNATAGPNELRRFCFSNQQPASWERQ